MKELEKNYEEEVSVESGVAAAPTKKTTMKASRRQALIFVWVMIAIPLVHSLFFWFYGNIKTVLLAFQDMRTGAWTFDNFKTTWESVTSSDGTLGLAIKNTLAYFFSSIIVVIPTALFISFFIYKRIFGFKVFRVIFYFPAIISGMVMVTAFTNFIDPKGPLGYLMEKMGNPLPPEGLLGRPSTATPTIVVYSIWTSFTTNILFLSGAMSRIPIEVLESAKLEGANPWQEVTKIIFPLIWPTFSTMLLLQFTSILGSSGPILLFTNGAQETTTLSFWMFTQVYGDGVLGGTGQYNLLSSTGLFFTVIVMPIILFFRWLSGKVEDIEY